MQSLLLIYDDQIHDKYDDRIYDKYEDQIYDDFLTQIYNKYDDQFVKNGFVSFQFMIKRLGLVLKFPYTVW